MLDQSANNQSGDDEPALVLRGIVKRFGGVAALRGVDLALRAGEIHALIGENGAGKSTLINVSTGVFRPDEGTIEIEGRPITLGSPLDATRHGIHVVHQEADLFAELSLAENMLLGRGLVRNGAGLIDWNGVYAQAQRELAAIGETADVRAPAGTIAIGRRVLAEIAACVALEPKVLFLDEPTASLTHGESQRLFARLEELKRAGVAIVYVSHRLEEVLAICDTITVLRDGTHIQTAPTGEYTMEKLIALMVGRENTGQFTAAHTHGAETVLEIAGFSNEARTCRNVSLSVRAGEIVGLYGLVGAGRSELARGVFGLDAAQGSVKVRGKELPLGDPRGAVERGLAYLPEDRLTEAIFARHPCRENVTSAILTRLTRFGLIQAKRERSVTAGVVQNFRVKLGTEEQAINTLSGGNQQKLMLGRWLESAPDVMILDEPTRGVDVGAKAEMHRAIDELATAGKAILLISSELPEVMRLSDRVLVMCNGELTGEFDPRTTSEDAIAAAAIPRAATEQAADAVAQAQPAGVSARLLRLRELGIGIALLLLAGGLALFKPEQFATAQNIIDVLTAAAITSVGAAGITLVIVAGGIDISIGSMLGLLGACAGMAAMRGAPPALSVGLALGLGALLGGLNSALSALGRIHPIVVTLAGISIYRGIMLELTGGYEINPLPDSFRALTDGRIAGVPKVLWIALAVLAVNALVLGRTLLGRRLLAVGNSERAARLIGISPWRYRIYAFMMMGALVGLAAVMTGGYYGKIQSGTGAGWELQVIAAAVIGGCSINGGRGTALGAFLGAVLIALIRTGLVIVGISAYWQDFFIGLMILLAVALDTWLPIALARMRARSAAQEASPAQ